MGYWPTPCHRRQKEILLCIQSSMASVIGIVTYGEWWKLVNRGSTPETVTDHDVLLPKFLFANIVELCVLSVLLIAIIEVIRKKEAG